MIKSLSFELISSKSSALARSASLSEPSRFDRLIARSCDNRASLLSVYPSLDYARGEASKDAARVSSARFKALLVLSFHCATLSSYCDFFSTS